MTRTLEKSSQLLLRNDKINSFDRVFIILVDQLRMEKEQAEQCALLAHLKGECVIREGTEKSLALISKKLNSHGLTTYVS